MDNSILPIHKPNPQPPVQQSGGEGSEEEYHLLLPPVEHQETRVKTKLRWKPMISGVGAAVLGAAAIGLLALAVIKDYGNAYNALITLGLGMAFQASIQLIPFRKDGDSKTLTRFGKFIDFEKDKLVKYAAIYYICMTQLFLNITQTRSIERGFYGSFNFLMGALFATLIDSIANWKLKDSRIPDTTIETASLNDYLEGSQEILPAPVALPSYERTIRMLPIDKSKAGARAKENQARVLSDIAKLVLSTGIIVTFSVAYYVSPNSTLSSAAPIPIKFANILLGHAVGCLGHEVVYSIHNKVKEKHPPQIQNDGVLGSPKVYTPLPIKVMMAIEKTERIVGVVFPGLVIALYNYNADNLISGPDIAAGLLMGMVRQIDMIHFTQNPANRLELEDKTQMGNLAAFIAEKVAKWAFAIFVVGGFLVLGITLGILQGPLINAVALGTVAAVLYPAYALAKWASKQKIDENSSPLTNSLYFYTNYSIAAPVVYIAVTQVMEIGDIALDSYGIAESMVASLGWASLAWAFGIQAGSRNTGPYPKEVDPLIILFTFFFVQQLTGQAPS